MSLLLNPLPKPKEIKKKHKSTTTEITLQSHPNYNKQLTDILEEMGLLEKNRGQVHKFKAYQKAIRALKNHPKKLTSGKEATKLNGIGKKIANKIDEILESGHLFKLDKELEDDRTRAINSLSQVSGIGPAAAKKFVDEEGIMSLSDLKKNYEKLNNHQKIGLKYFDDFSKRIPRREVEQIEKVVLDCLIEIDKRLEGKICGSYRRGVDTSGDVDILITHPDYHEENKKNSDLLTKIVELLHKKNVLTDDISFGNLKYMGVVQLVNFLVNYFLKHLIRMELMRMVNHTCTEE